MTEPVEPLVKTLKSRKPPSCDFCDERASLTNIIFQRGDGTRHICGSCVVTFSMHMTMIGEAGGWDFTKRH